MSKLFDLKPNTLSISSEVDYKKKKEETTELTSCNRFYRLGIIPCS